MMKKEQDLRDAAEFLARCDDVWDLTLPWVRMYWNIDVLQRYWQAGYTYVSLTVQDMPPSFEGVLQDISDFRAECETSKDWLCFAGSDAEISAAREQGKLALGINVQDTALVHPDLERLSVLRDQGVRHMLLAYQTRNLAADGCAEPSDGGLSLFGRRLVRKMNEVGMIVDASHVGRQSSLDAIEHSEAPVIFSHSGVSAVHEHIRNIDDDQIRACAESGGAVGVVGIGVFLGDFDASAEMMFRHIDHIAQLVGPEHVGIGTDFIDDIAPIWDAINERGGDAWHPAGPQVYGGVAFAPEQLVELVSIMLRNGYDEIAINGVLGANFRRIYGQFD